jgi:hypothetical protein
LVSAVNAAAVDATVAHWVHVSHAIVQSFARWLTVALTAAADRGVTVLAATANRVVVLPTNAASAR